MIPVVKKVVETLDGSTIGVDGDMPCNLSGSCKMRITPGDIVRYSGAILLALFGLLLVISLFFPNLISNPNIGILNDLIDVVHRIFGSDIVIKPN